MHRGEDEALRSIFHCAVVVFNTALEVLLVPAALRDPQPSVPSLPSPQVLTCFI